MLCRHMESMRTFGTKGASPRELVSTGMGETGNSSPSPTIDLSLGQEQPILEKLLGGADALRKIQS